MIWIENTTVLGFDTAIRGMRNPLGSWAKSDSGYDEILGEYVIGDADKSLMKKLVAAGTDHSKFMRMITVTCDITAPQYFVAELDTYKIGTVRNSCSLQHTGAKKPFTIDDFSAPAIVKEILAPEKKSREYPLVYPECAEDDYSELAEAWEEIINCLNELRDLYMETGDYDYFIAMRAMMPMGYNYRFTWQANYTVLRNVYHARKHHKLREWHAFCRWIETLPQADLITGGNCDET